MPLQNKLTDKNRIAYFGALTLLLSYAEMMIPRIVPFLKLGLGNIIILLALPMDFLSFLLLILIKSIAFCFTAGTLFSPFFILSLGQSFGSGLIMYFLFRIKGKWISIYGISLTGSAVSAFIQILLSSIYIGKGTFSLLGVMLIFSVFSGLLTAFLSQKMNIREKTPSIIENENCDSSIPETAILLITVIFSSTVIFMTDKISLLFCSFLITLIFQLLCGRKFKILPHLFLWIFIFLANLFVPDGKVLFSIWKITITKGALINSISKALKISSVMCLSQCCTNISLKKFTIIPLTFSYFNGLLKIFSDTKGNIFTKIKIALEADKLQDLHKNKKNPSVFISIPVFICFFMILIVRFFYFQRF